MPGASPSPTLTAYFLISFSLLFLSLKCLWGTFIPVHPAKPRAVALEAPPVRPADEVWGFSAMPDCKSFITNPFYTAQLALRAPDVTEGVCPNQRLPTQQNGKPCSPLAPNPDPSSLPYAVFCCTELGCWFLACLFPSQIRQGPAISLNHSLIQSTNTFYPPTWCQVQG